MTKQELELWIGLYGRQFNPTRADDGWICDESAKFAAAVADAGVSRLRKHLPNLGEITALDSRFDPPHIVVVFGSHGEVRCQLGDVVRAKVTNNLLTLDRVNGEIMCFSIENGYFNICPPKSRNGT
jgi:hypothetical protein